MAVHPNQLQITGNNQNRGAQVQGQQGQQARGRVFAANAQEQRNEPKPKKGIGILKKIDRIMGNVQFTDLFPASCAMFQPYMM